MDNGHAGNGITRELAFSDIIKFLKLSTNNAL